MEAHFPPFDTINRARSHNPYGLEEAQKQQYAATRDSAPPPSHSGGPLPSLAEQLQRVGILRSRVGALAERVIGPRGSGIGQAESPTAYGGILGALEGETATLRRYISEMLDDIGAIESALS